MLYADTQSVAMPTSPAGFACVAGFTVPVSL